MNFISLEFWIFFIIVVFGCFILEKYKKEYRIYLLLAASYFFYAYWDYRFCLLLFLVTLLAYICARKNNKASLCIGTIVPTIVLFVFKYFNFFLEAIGINDLNIIIPIGISFYIFEAISYVVDVYRKKIEAEKNFAIFALYLSFFPNILSGPIERAGNLLVQFKEERKIELNNLTAGIQIILFGLIKKMVIADRLGRFVDDVYSHPSVYSWLSILLCVLSYSLQIYCDFSGYSDIAIGCAKCLGYDFKKNFNLPYLSINVTEFWRRWHISLSTWFKDYVYIPLGGNRKGASRQLINLLVVMTLSGLWHGANYTYIIWGFVNGLLLCLEKKFLKTNIKIINVLFNYLLMSFTWILFRAENMNEVISIIKGIVSLQSGIIQIYTWSVIFLFIGLVVIIFRLITKNDEQEYHLQDLNTIKGLTIFFIEIGVLLCFAYVNTNPFVYFQF